MEGENCLEKASFYVGNPEGVTSVAPSAFVLVLGPVLILL